MTTPAPLDERVELLEERVARLEASRKPSRFVALSMEHPAPGIYRHFKGNVVELLFVAKHSEGQEQLAVYRHDGEIWCRPLAMWSERVVVHNYVGPRFTWISEVPAREETPNANSLHTTLQDEWLKWRRDNPPSPFEVALTNGLHRQQALAIAAIYERPAPLPSALQAEVAAVLEACREELQGLQDDCGFYRDDSTEKVEKRLAALLAKLKGE